MQADFTSASMSFNTRSNPDLREQLPRQSAAIATPNLQIQDLSVQYRAVEALKGVSLTLQPGRLIGIFGPNGAGKSTLIKAMLGLIPASGQALWGDRPLADQLGQVAYVPQRSQIDWTYPATVWDVVMMGRVRKTGWFQRFSASSRQTAMAALERVGMAELRDRPIGQLSGGQQQRVFLARALAQQASVFCLDEPFTGIDQKTQEIIFQILRELAAEDKMVLVINHDLGESTQNFDDVLLLNKSVVAFGDRAQVMTPDNLYQTYGGRVLFAA